MEVKVKQSKATPSPLRKQALFGEGSGGSHLKCPQVPISVGSPIRGSWALGVGGAAVGAKPSPVSYSRTNLVLLSPQFWFSLPQDMVTYYLNLTRANMRASPREEELPVWEEEYRLTEAFQVPDGSARSMQTVLERISRDQHYLQLYYEFNSARYDLEQCQQECRVDHMCAIREVDFTKYEECVKTNSSASAASSVWLLVFCIFLGFLSSQRVL